MGRHAVWLLLVLVFSTTAWGYYISNVTVSPLNPTTETPVTVTVTGNAPATNYHLDSVNRWQLGNFIFIDMYWTSTDIGATVMVPYTHDESLGTLAAGHYTVYVRSFYDSLVRESKSVSFSVSKATDASTWPGFFWHYWWWPGTGGSWGFIQTQIIVIGNTEISFEFSFSN
jgi:hypothetical protein